MIPDYPRNLSKLDMALAFIIVLATVWCMIAGLSAAAWLLFGFGTLRVFAVVMVIGAIGAVLLARHIIPQVYVDETDEAGA